MAINTYKGNKQAVLVNMVGGFTLLNSFSFPSSTEVGLSCSLVFNNKLYVFGGTNERRQISTVHGCGLKCVGSLNFDFKSGACTTVQGSRILLCFGYSTFEGKVCRISNHPTGPFAKIRESNYHHYRAKIASNKGLLIKDLFFIEFRYCCGCRK